MKSSIQELKVVPLKTITPYWRNPRKNDKAVGPVMESIKRFGYCQPIVVDKKMTIVAGHTRYRALSQLGAKEAQVIVVDLPPAIAKQYRIVDNKTAEFATWDNESLAAELREFENLEKDFQVFFQDDLKSFVDETSGGKVGDVTNDKVKKTKDKLEKKYAEVSRTDQIEVACPECEASFYLNRKDLLDTAAE